MSNNELHLFVFEGRSAEPKYAEKLERNFLGEKVAVKCVYGTDIYRLYEQFKHDGFALDMVNLLKECNPENAALLHDYNRDSFAYIYLFFDYDAHATLADDDKISEMLAFFDNETENGMLYISYPMVEAIRHYKDMESFKELTVKCKRTNCPNRQNCEEAEDCLKEAHYKELVSKECRPQLVNVNKYDSETWKELIRAHVSKMNNLVHDSFELPAGTETQKTVFAKQQEKHILQHCPKVAVLSAFPMYVLDYYGAEPLRRKSGE